MKNNFYLSRILGNKIYTPDMKVIGRLSDLGVVNELKSPHVTTAKVKTNSGIKDYDFKNFSITKQKGQYILICNKIEEYTPPNTLFLRKHILDQQIIDVNGRKVVRVNDVSLSYLEKGASIVAVDIGIDGLLRRIGIAKPLKMLGLKVSTKLMLWNDVEAIITSNENIVLSKTYDSLSILHPSDLADIIEDFDAKTGLTIFSSLDNAKAADVLEEMEEEAQVSFIESLSPDKAADVLENMPADEAADILDGMSEEKVEELLNSMEKEAAGEIRELLGYDSKAVGSLMSTDFVSFNNNETINEAIEDLRILKPEEDELFSLYVVDENDKLIGTLSLRDLIISEPTSKISAIMNKKFKSMFDTDSIKDLIKNVSKYNLVAIPVTNHEMKLLGNVIINDIIYELLKNKRKVS
ncbi:CBS domain-containing protein [Clostridium tagluense]|uniref:magnesium transporter n=1 Tax=Clostridium tagluense TaxID=360422 RepID=UPI001CF582A1|nr:CBS domain-containing protein [Clostridium tagluense]MCB2309697.1 CBS domain-containing protein [Clostridium tagluense]MCB2314773.1 CBS domain-containing protein [Clostridium tagluense]MCB2319622.1 CBS domain-containing protein [Clostridium tagluense]MCB2324291.1 CBS domain-containing protein [Clostridium tagluense]MCB2329142.1 CBS domain-containing protein [Clostridium tagluense]